MDGRTKLSVEVAVRQIIAYTFDGDTFEERYLNTLYEIQLNT